MNFETRHSHGGETTKVDSPAERSGAGPKDEKKAAYLSIIVPLYNEEESIERLVRAIFDVGRGFPFYWELVLVDEGSSDGTWQILERLTLENPSGIRAVRFRRNYGQTSAMVAGFEYARGEIIVTMDGDLQNDPADIPLLLAELEKGNDIVSGWRKNRKDHFSRVLPSRIANALISITTGVKLHDYGCSLKAYRSECIRSIKAYGEMHRFFPALASMTGARVTEIPVNHHPRRYGVSKYGFGRIFKVFSDIFSMNLIIRFSSMPLKGFALCALPCLGLMFFFAALALLAAFLDWTPGKASLFMIVSALNGMISAHLLVLGMLGEMIVGMSDLSHTDMPEITKRSLNLE
ncbi:MAG: glycosyltransferase family 2 protein [Thermodesulfobacteriota bacterium]